MQSNQVLLRQHIPEKVFLRASQASGETDIGADDQVAAVAGVLRAHHAQTGIMLFVAGLSWTGLRHADGLPVNSADNALPACQCFLQAEIHRCNKVVTRTLESRMIDLYMVVSNGSSSVFVTARSNLLPLLQSDEHLAVPLLPGLQYFCI